MWHECTDISKLIGPKTMFLAWSSGQQCDAFQSPPDDPWPWGCAGRIGQTFRMVSSNDWPEVFCMDSVGSKCQMSQANGWHCYMVDSHDQVATVMRRSVWITKDWRYPLTFMANDVIKWIWVPLSCGPLLMINELRHYEVLVINGDKIFSKK